MSSDRYYKFICVRNGDEVHKILDSTEHCWFDLMEEFRQFLNGCGYQVPAGEWHPYVDNDDDDQEGEYW